MSYDVPFTDGHEEEDGDEFAAADMDFALRMFRHHLSIAIGEWPGSDDELATYFSAVAADLTIGDPVGEA